MLVKDLRVENIRLYFTYMILLLLSLWVLTPNDVKADSVQFGGFSYHIVSEDTNTNFHRALIYEADGLTFGYLKNSHGNDSFMGAYRIWDERDKGTTTEIYLGAVRGYEKCYGDFNKGDTKKDKVIACPLLLINVTIETGTKVKPVISLWGDALVLSGRYNF